MSCENSTVASEAESNKHHVIQISATLRELLDRLADAVASTADLVQQIKAQAESEGLTLEETRELMITVWDWLVSPIPTVRESITGFLTKWLPAQFTGFAGWISTTLGPILRSAFVGVWNGVVNVINSAGNAIASGVNSIVGGIVSALNVLIDAYNSAAAILGRGGISPINFSGISFQNIPVIAAANGANFMTNGPTMMLVGEAGPEHVSVTPSGGGRGGGGTYIINFNNPTFTGDLEFKRKVDAALKETLKKHGWT